MKNKILFSTIIFFSLSFNSFSAEKGIINIEKKVNVKILEYEDGLYYLKDQLYTGLFYNLFSSEGPANNSIDSYFEGELINGERQGEWVWYRNNDMSHKQVYNDGKLISDVIVINNKELKLKH